MLPASVDVKLNDALVLFVVAGGEDLAAQLCSSVFEAASAGGRYRHSAYMLTANTCVWLTEMRR